MRLPRKNGSFRERTFQDKKHGKRETKKQHGKQFKQSYKNERDDKNYTEILSYDDFNDIQISGYGYGESPGYEEDAEFSECIREYIRQGDTGNIKRVLRGVYRPMEGCECCDTTDLNVCLHSDKLEIFKLLLPRSSDRTINRAALESTSPDRKKFLVAIIEEKGELPSDVCRYFFTSKVPYGIGNLETLVKYRELLVFLGENGGDLALLFANGDGTPAYVRHLVELGASVDSDVIFDEQSNLCNWRLDDRTTFVPYISFRKFVETGQSSIMRKGICTDKFKKEYLSILNMEFWRKFVKYNTFPGKYVLEKADGFEELVSGLTRFDGGVLSRIKEYF